MAFNSTIELIKAVSCPICNNYLNDAVFLRCGHTYCFPCIKYHFDSNECTENYKSCPECKTHVAEVYPNSTMVQIINLVKYKAFEENHNEEKIREERELLIQIQNNFQQQLENQMDGMVQLLVDKEKMLDVRNALLDRKAKALDTLRDYLYEKEQNLTDVQLHPRLSKQNRTEKLDSTTICLAELARLCEKVLCDDTTLNKSLDLLPEEDTQEDSQIPSTVPVNSFNEDNSQTTDKDGTVMRGNIVADAMNNGFTFSIDLSCNLPLDLNADDSEIESTLKTTTARMSTKRCSRNGNEDHSAKRHKNK